MEHSHKGWARMATTVAGGLTTVLATLVLPSPAVAQEQPDEVQQLADTYAPILMLKAQEEPCDDQGEPYEPTSVDVVLDNPQILLRVIGDGDPVMGPAPGRADLHDLGEAFFLDFPGNALDPGCIYEEDFRRYSGERPPVVYAHIAQQPDEPDKLALQYWFFWYYNDWNNKHEGDWEGIQLLFDVGTVEDALRAEPVSVGYAQHEGGELADWDAEKLEREGARPVVYSSRGSHASYFGSALYLGRSGSEGFGCDTTDGPSRSIDPEVVVLPDSVDQEDDDLAWLAFDGRCGEVRFGPFSGPTGPATKDRWDAPVDWHDDLRSASVVVPAGDGAAAGVVNTFCAAVERGSSLLIVVSENPVVLLIVVAILAGVIGWLLRRTDWGIVDPLPIVRRRRAGQLLRAAGRLYRSNVRLFAVSGLIYIPLALVVAVIVWLVAQIPLVGALLESEGELGPIGAFFALTIGLLGHALGFVVVRAVVAVAMRGVETGDGGTAVDALRTVARHAGDLVQGLVRIIVVVGVLFVSVVGIPWGIRQLVRYQFFSDVIVLEDVDGTTALDRSTALTRGRWWHTAAVLLVLNGLVLGISTVAGLLLLIVTAGLPLWLFSSLLVAMSAIVVPYGAIGATMLYGDAVAEQEDPAQAVATRSRPAGV